MYENLWQGSRGYIRVHLWRGLISFLDKKNKPEMGQVVIYEWWNCTHHLNHIPELCREKLFLVFLFFILLAETWEKGAYLCSGNMLYLKLFKCISLFFLNESCPVSLLLDDTQVAAPPLPSPFPSVSRSLTIYLFSLALISIHNFLSACRPLYCTTFILTFPILFLTVLSSCTSPSCPPPVVLHYRSSFLRIPFTLTSINSSIL